MQDLTLEYIASFRNGQTDAEIIGTAKQPGDEWFIDHHDTYAWYRAVAAAKRPERILELGVRYGYALLAMALGAGKTRPLLIGIDSEFDGIASNFIASKNLHMYPHEIIKVDTQNCLKVTQYLTYETAQNFDIIHVDGNHSPDGIKNELALAAAWIAPDGWILVDDIDTPHVLREALQFAVKHELNSVRIPTFHNMLLLDMGSRIV